MLFSVNILAAPKIVKHELGQAQISGVPKRVVVFDYGLLDIVDAVGGNVVGVVKDNLPQSLKKFSDKKYTNIGTLFTFIPMAIIATVSFFIALRLWSKEDEISFEHVHTDLPEDHKHILENQKNGVHIHEYMFDEYHQKWPK